MNNKSELESLVAMGRAAKAIGAADMEHLDGPSAAYNYVRIADLICSYCQERPEQLPILDWGCGYGQVSWLLRERGLDVLSYDVERRPLRGDIPDLESLPVVYGDDPVEIPYEANRFGSVLSVGVLEHVTDFEGSIAEISRVLRPGGLLFIFMLPNKYSWAEWIADRRGISAHPFKFTFENATELLHRHDFAVDKRWRRHVLPRNLTGFRPRVKQIYGKFYRAVESVDHTLTSLPPVCYLSGVIEMIARKR
ncbi:MAG TPA: class I SAM-dependent methyltransferase [Bryobacteraceae bacterium]|jgi:SAM-dependent methyltransferase